MYRNWRVLVLKAPRSRMREHSLRPFLPFDIDTVHLIASPKHVKKTIVILFSYCQLLDNAVIYQYAAAYINPMITHRENESRFPAVLNQMPNLSTTVTKLVLIN